MSDKRKIIIGTVFLIIILAVILVPIGIRNTGTPSDIVSVSGDSIAESTKPVQENADSNTKDTVEAGDVIPTIRPEISATDPSTVNLVSGNVQFVEAFAFW
jgi:hypothetical protein